MTRAVVILITKKNFKPVIQITVLSEVLRHNRYITNKHRGQMDALNMTILNIAFTNQLDAEIGRTFDGKFALYIEVEDSESIELFSHFADRIVPDEDMIVIALY